MTLYTESHRYGDLREEEIKEKRKFETRLKNMEEEIKLLKSVIKALCRGKKDHIHDATIIDSKGIEWRGIMNDFEHEMSKIDFNYKKEGD